MATFRGPADASWQIASGAGLPRDRIQAVLASLGTAYDPGPATERARHAHRGGSTVERGGRWRAMTGVLGIDTAAARLHATRMFACARRVDDVAEALSAAIRTVDWDGPDAEDFRLRWSQGIAQQATSAASAVRTAGTALLSDAAQQDQASEPDADTEGQTPLRPSGDPACDAPVHLHGYRTGDDPVLPDWLERPLEDAASDIARTVSEGIGIGVDLGFEGTSELGERWGVRTEGSDQLHRDLERWGETWTDLATGERVPSVAELLAGGALVTGSAHVAAYEALTGRDTLFLDDRPGGVVHDVRTTTVSAQGAATLQDLVLDNDALRLSNPGRGALEAGQIGIRTVQGTVGTDPVYIVQVPPTEGAGLLDPAAYGGQGNSRDWGSNVRLVAGQHPAAMDDVRAAMAAPGPDGRPLVPPGAQVMFVGHSQGGIVSADLAADPAFNNTSGAPGTYDVTTSFSVGSPVQTVVPAQSGTDVVNVTHGPVTIDPVTGEATGDPIAHADVQGLQVDGGRLRSPNVHEVVLSGPSAPIGMRWLTENHDSVDASGGPRADGGYAATLGATTASDPTLLALERRLTGVYIGPGTEVTSSSVVTVGR